MSLLSPVDLYLRCDAEFAARVAAVGERWDAPTALPGWDVRALVQHIVEEQRWAPPLFAGLTIEEVGGLVEGDQLVPDPITAARDASGAACDAVREPGAMERTVHLSFGDHPGEEYARQLAADHLVHAWDLARALGVDERLDPDAVETVLTWFGTEDPLTGSSSGTAEDSYREMGWIGPRAPVPDGADPQAELIARFGRRP